MKRIYTPIAEEQIRQLKVGDTIEISGNIICGRDAVLPRIVSMIEDGTIDESIIDLNGQVVFHTAVSPAGVGPTSSNKLEIENSMIPLSKAGVRIHLGKGKINDATVRELKKYNAIYAIIPPITALLKSKTSNVQVIAFPELGMEALYMIKAAGYPAIVASANGNSIYK